MKKKIYFTFITITLLLFSTNCTHKQPTFKYLGTEGKISLKEDQNGMKEAMEKYNVQIGDTVLLIVRDDRICALVHTIPALSSQDIGGWKPAVRVD